MLLAALAAAALSMGHSAPAAGATATLTTPREIVLTLDGHRWSCDATGQCIGRGGGAGQPLMRECRRFVVRVGAVSTYARDGLALTEAEVARCNTAVRP